MFPSGFSSRPVLPSGDGCCSARILPIRLGTSLIFAASLSCGRTVLQIEIHPYLTRPALVAVCKERGIGIQAYAPLVQAAKFSDPKLIAIAAEVGRTPAQVLIRWSLQKGARAHWAV